MKASRVFCLLFAVLFMLCAGTVNVCAEETPSITIKYTHEECSFDFYKVADFSKENGLELTPAFAQYTETVSLLDEFDTLDAEDMRTLATTLEIVAKQNHISPLYESSTDENGELTVSGIELGTYLVVGEQTYDENFVYTPAPIFVSVSYGYLEDEFQYNIIVEHAKYEKDEFSQEVSCKVIKIWNDTGYEYERPQSITVQLLKDSAVCETVTLSVENNWMHEWTKLEAGHDWKVAELNVPENYKMYIEKSGNTFAIENTYSNNGDGDVESTTDSSGDSETTTVSDKTGNDGNNGGGNVTKPNNYKEDDKIISTGQLWWPVPILIILGITFVAMGLIKQKEEYI